MRSSPPLLILIVALFACAPPEDGDTPAAPPPAATFVAPADGATVQPGTVTVTLAARHITLQPAGVDAPNSGHLHLFVDRDLTPEDSVIPAEPGIVHMGDGRTGHELANLAPGGHRLIVVLGDARHVRIPGAGTDTVRITVR